MATYDDLERSEYGGKPVELFHFVHELSVWKFTDSEESVVADGAVYDPLYAITRDEPELALDEMNKSEVTISTSTDNPVAQLFQYGPPYGKVWVTIFRMHRGMSTAVPFWQGRVKARKANLTQAKAELVCEPIEAVLGKVGFRQSYSPQCTKKLYSSRCCVNEGSFRTTTTVEVLGATTIQATAFSTKPNGYFTQGEAYFPDLRARVKIISHAGSTLGLSRIPPGLQTGMQVLAVAGCDHVWNRSDGSPGDCRAKFSNGINFLGWPFTPIKNPYEVGLEG